MIYMIPAGLPRAMSSRTGRTAAESCEKCGGDLVRQPNSDVYECQRCGAPVSACFL